MLVTFSKPSTLCRLKQLANALSGMAEMFVRPLMVVMAQDSKAPLPMLVTLLKPSMLARELQLKNASAPMWTSFPPISSVFN